jgi:hypothetical protein
MFSAAMKGVKKILRDKVINEMIKLVTLIFPINLVRRHQ